MDIEYRREQFWFHDLLYVIKGATKTGTLQRRVHYYRISNIFGGHSA